MHFGTGKSRDVLCRVCRTAHYDKRDAYDMYVFRGVATTWTGVDISTPLFPEVVPPKVYANPEHKRLNLNTRALLLLRRQPCLNKYGATRTTSATRSSRRARHLLLGPCVHDLWIGRITECRNVVKNTIAVVLAVFSMFSGPIESGLTELY